VAEQFRRENSEHYGVVQYQCQLHFWNRFIDTLNIVMAQKTGTILEFSMGILYHHVNELSALFA